jgi:peptidoglycan hydrolase-like protein with peptidoglycan-binding domain
VAEAAPAPAADPVLVRMQTILAEKGLYSGEIDGLMGPKSAAAIRTWEKNNGYAETGEASPGLLAVMDKGAAPAAPVEVASSQPAASPTPKPRPAPAVASDARAGEPVTISALIADGPSELVRQIQSGLSNIAYADITVDGVAGSQTRAAISAFEKHYRLPVTGEPNETVLKKLREIGAL